MQFLFSLEAFARRRVTVWREPTAVEMKVAERGGEVERSVWGIFEG